MKWRGRRKLPTKCSGFRCLPQYLTSWRDKVSLAIWGAWAALPQPLALYVAAAFAVLLFSYFILLLPSRTSSSRRKEIIFGSPFKMSLVKSSGGTVGLYNVGNTCFMNSILQILAHTKPLVDYCLHDRHKSDINKPSTSVKGSLMSAFSSLLHVLWHTKEPAVNPYSFKDELQKYTPHFVGYSQEDAQEFLRYLLQGLHDDINNVNSKMKASSANSCDEHSVENQKADESWKKYLNTDNSKIIEIFAGQLKSSLKCVVCGHKSVTFDPFWDLSLPLPLGTSHTTIQQCLALFTKEEILDGKNKPECEKCKVFRKSTKSLGIFRFPKILVLHLKRFSSGKNSHSKLNTEVEFPLSNLDMSPYAASNSKEHWTTYNLYAVSNHIGRTNSGHYTAYCCHPYSREWHEFNDSKVSKIKQGDVVTSKAYVLFYEQVNQSSRL